ncbi:hypothetical protein [Amnibacterium endophyticum]|uniref:Uncharacterized protein n=1 Tax=Amnibacterium endophyticum TaxID=2109337 RepID=A0ABW4LGR3_9MICO
MAGEDLTSEADAIFARAARPQRLWPLAIGVLVLYLASSFWAIERPFGGSGREAVLHSTPTWWVPLLIVGVVLGGRRLGRLEQEAGGSPWRWPRIARRTLIGLAIALPLMSFAVAPASAVIAADAGSTHVGLPASLVVQIGIDPR